MLLQKGLAGVWPENVYLVGYRDDGILRVGTYFCHVRYYP